MLTFFTQISGIGFNWLLLYKDRPPIPTQSLERALRLILAENTFQFNGKNYLQTHGTAMATIVAVAFADIFMATVETELLNKSAIKPVCWKIYMDDIFSLCVTESPGAGYSLI